MVSKKHTPRVKSNVSSAQSLTVSAPASGQHASSVLKAAFAPSLFQLSLFASVIQGLDGQQLQVHDTQSNRLLCQHRVTNSQITTLDWGYYPRSKSQNGNEASKKRKRVAGDLNGIHPDSREVVIGFGTAQSEISFYSPTTSRITSSLDKAHSDGVREFRFHNYGHSNEAWSLGGDKNLVQWNLLEGTAIRTIGLPLSPPSTIFPTSSGVLVASHDTYFVNLSESSHVQKLSQGTNVIHSLLGDTSMSEPQSAKSYIAVSESERQALVYYHTGSTQQITALNADTEVLGASISDTIDPTDKLQALALVTKDNEVEVFTDPFNLQTRDQVAEPKPKSRNRARKAVASIRVCAASGSFPALPIADASFQGDMLIIACIEKPGSLGFERVRWREEETNTIALQGAIVRRRQSTPLGLHNGKQADREDSRQTKVDETNTVVARDGDMNVGPTDFSQPDAITISSAEEDSDEDEDEDDEDEGEGSGKSHQRSNGVMTKTSNPSLSQDAEVDALNTDVDTMIVEEPTFGDLIRANAPDVVNVVALAGADREQGIVPYEKSDGKISSGLSLGTVLTQALRANDKSLLESCLQEHDLHIVRATIERLDPALAVTLLQKLAEKLHSRPGRSGGLMVWVQWTLVSHGGHLASQPDLARKLTSLQHVIKARAESLQPLLSLKGKLDMLEAQMNLRKSMQSRSAMNLAATEDVEDGVVYVEGQSDSDSDALGDDAPETGDESEVEAESEDEEAGDADVHMESEVDENSEDDDNEGFIDDEASETDASDEKDIGEAVDYEDVDSIDEASEEEAPNPTRSVQKPLTNGVRRK